MDMISETFNFKVIDVDVYPKNMCGRCISDVRAAYRFKTNYERNVMLKGNAVDDFIDSLVAENWDLVTDFIKKEQEDASEECIVKENKPQIKTIKEENKPQTKTVKEEKKPQIKTVKTITRLKRVNTDDEVSKKSGKRVKANKTDTFTFCGKQNINVERPYKCPHCSRNFSQKELLLDHVAARHFFINYI